MLEFNLLLVASPSWKAFLNTRCRTQFLIKHLNLAILTQNEGCSVSYFNVLKRFGFWHTGESMEESWKRSRVVYFFSSTGEKTLHT